MSTTKKKKDTRKKEDIKIKLSIEELDAEKALLRIRKGGKSWAMVVGRER